METATKKVRTCALCFTVLSAYNKDRFCMSHPREKVAEFLKNERLNAQAEKDATKGANPSAEQNGKAKWCNPFDLNVWRAEMSELPRGAEVIRLFEAAVIVAKKTAPRTTVDLILNARARSHRDEYRILWDLIALCLKEHMRFSDDEIRVFLGYQRMPFLRVVFRRASFTLQHDSGAQEMFASLQQAMQPEV